MSRFDLSILKEGRTRDQRQQAVEIMDAALDAVDPEQAVKRMVRLEGEVLHVESRRYDLSRYRNVYVVGAGKAGASMARAVEEVLGPRLTAGAVNVKDGHAAVETHTVRIQEAAHPLPDERGVQGTRRIVGLLRQAGEDDLVLCLLSGGGSALLVLPQEPLTLADLQGLTNALLACGATINEINALRKHLSQVKGGQLARLAQPAEVVSLILSDVVGNPLSVIASGPTVPDPTTFAEAAGVLEKYGLWDKVPPAVAQHIRKGLAGEVPDTPKAGDACFARTYHALIGSNEIAARAALAQAQALGFNTLLLSTFVEGEAREVGKVFAAIAREIKHSGQPLPPPACVVAGGETTVTLCPEPGLGGRNQELALAAALKLDGLEDVLVIGLATDGTDGPTDATGALADGSTVRRAAALGLSAADHLARNAAYPFFQELGDLLRTGPTYTNVNDLTLVLVW